MTSVAFVDPAANVAAVPAPRAGAARELATRFEALLLESAFAPLAKAMGFYGDAVVEVATQALLRGTSGGLGEQFERAIAADPSEGAGS